MLKIATWNINSVRLRLDLVLRLLKEAAPDVLCLQETKTQDNGFPVKAFAEAGYPHCHIAGIKGYNGVAIVSRHPLSEPQTYARCGRSDGRHVSARLPGGVEVHSIYIPAGGDEPDPETNEKFAHKLDFLRELTAWWPETRRPDQPIIATGDFNIAPLETDVWSHKQLLKVVSHTPIEVEHLGAMQASLNWLDGIRAVISPEEKLFTWWSYRSRDWSASDRGRRLDHIWVTPPLASAVTSAEVWRHARGWEPRPSDHVPVLLTLDMSD